MQMTLPQILDYNWLKVAAITRSHNAVMDRLVKVLIAQDSRRVCVNRRVGGFENNVRSDFKAIDDNAKTVFLIDVTMPLENCHAAF